MKNNGNMFLTAFLVIFAIILLVFAFINIAPINLDLNDLTDLFDDDSESSQAEASVVGGGGSSSFVDYTDAQEDAEAECEYIDTDGGYKINLQGTCDDGKAILFTDYCSGDTLYEYYLGAGDACFDGCQLKDWSCEFGCDDGACLPEPEAGINDACDLACTLQKTEPNNLGLCAYYNPIGKISPGVVCLNINAEYNSLLDNRCEGDSICCCR